MSFQNQVQDPQLNPRVSPPVSPPMSRDMTAILKLLIPSLIGIVIFFVPLTFDGKTTIVGGETGGGRKRGRGGEKIQGPKPTGT